MQSTGAFCADCKPLPTPPLELIAEPTTSSPVRSLSSTSISPRQSVGTTKNGERWPPFAKIDLPCFSHRLS